MWAGQGKILLRFWVRLKRKNCRETPLLSDFSDQQSGECVSTALCFAWCFIFQLINVLIDWLSNQLAGADKMYWSPLYHSRCLTILLQCWTRQILLQLIINNNWKIVCKYFRSPLLMFSSFIIASLIPAQCPPNVPPCQVCRLSCSIVDTFIYFYPASNLVVCPALITILEALTISN